MFSSTIVGFFILLFVTNKNISDAKCLSDHSNHFNSSVNSKLIDSIISYMDFSKDPCENFYQYACGNWEKAHHTSGYLNYMDTIGSLEYQAKHQIVEILEERISRMKIETNDVYRKVRDFYEACRIDQDEGLRVDMYMAVFQQQDGLEWPSNLDEMNVYWNSSNFNWFKTLGVLRSYGLNNVLLAEDLRYKNSTDVIMVLDKPVKFGWGTYGNTYIKNMTKSSSSNDIQMSQKLQRFNTKLNNLNEGLGDNQFSFETNVNELHKRLNMTTGFEDYFSSLLGKSINSEIVIVVGSLRYLRKLIDLIDKTPKDTLASYLKVRLLSYLYDEMPRTSRREDCIAPMTRHMNMALDYIYEKEIYQFERPATDEVIIRVFERLKEKFGEIINEHSSDLQQDELHFLRRKISEMSLNIGNLPRKVRDSYFSDYYKNLQVQKAFFYWSHLNIMRHMVAKEHSQIELQNHQADLTYIIWPSPSPAYSQTRNLLVIPFAYMRQPIFHKDFHELFLFAELGNTLGHEIIHGFDTTGISYDAYGNPNELLLSALKDRDHFKRSLQCLQQDVTNSLDEKMADFSGFRLAFEAYFDRASTEKFHMPSLNLSKKQLFFVKFAQFFCAVSENQIAYDGTHDTPFSRVPQVVWNYEEFDKEFNCISHMKSANASRWRRGGKTCHVW